MPPYLGRHLPVSESPLTLRAGRVLLPCTTSFGTTSFFGCPTCHLAGRVALREARVHERVHDRHHLTEPRVLGKQQQSTRVDKPQQSERGLVALAALVMPSSFTTRACTPRCGTCVRADKLAGLTGFAEVTSDSGESNGVRIQLTTAYKIVIDLLPFVAGRHTRRVRGLWLVHGGLRRGRASPLG